MYGNDETDQIVDYLSNRINTLTIVSKAVFQATGQQDQYNVAKIQELEDARAFIVVNFC